MEKQFKKTQSLKACEQMHGELKEQELIHAQCEKQAKDAIEIVKSETIKEVEEILDKSPVTKYGMNGWFTYLEKLKEL